MKHPHHDVIVAFAEGKPIQYKHPQLKEWKDVDPKLPVCFYLTEYDYRIKPEPKKYRVAMFRLQGGHGFQRLYSNTYYSEEGAASAAGSENFSHWLTDWEIDNESL